MRRAAASHSSSLRPTKSMARSMTYRSLHSRRATIRQTIYAASTRPVRSASTVHMAARRAPPINMSWTMHAAMAVDATVFRMSCIYGPHQYGTEDQGWVAHFLIRAQQDLPITIYGDGKQVRDLLYVDDLIEAFWLAEDHLPEIAGQAFNIGGGADNTISLCELVERISALNGDRRPKSPMAPGGSATSVGTCQTPANSNAPRDGAPRPMSTTASGSCTSGFPSIAGRLRRRGWSDHEGSADKPELVIRRQYLFRMPRAAFAAGIRLRQGSADARRP